MSRFILLIFLMFSPAALAAPVSLTYAVYGGGLHVVDAGLKLSETKDRYAAHVTAATTGMLATLAPWAANVHSEGWKAAKGWTPQRHEFTTKWRDDSKTAIMNYDRKGNLVERIVREKGHPEDKTPADKALTDGAIDLPTGILNFLRHRDVKQGCEGAFAVYDGKRRFQVILANQKEDTVPKSRYGIFSGPAISCTVEIKPDGGNWSKKNRGWFKIQEDSRSKGQLPRISLAALPGIADWLVPVRLDVASPYGAFVMHLTGTNGAVK